MEVVNGSFDYFGQSLFDLIRSYICESPPLHTGRGVWIFVHAFSACFSVDSAASSWSARSSARFFVRRACTSSTHALDNIGKRCAAGSKEQAFIFTQYCLPRSFLQATRHAAEPLAACMAAAIGLYG